MLFQLFNCLYIHTMMIHTDTFTVQLKNPKSCINTVVAYVYACKSCTLEFLFNNTPI